MKMSLSCFPEVVNMSFILAMCQHFIRTHKKGVVTGENVEPAEIEEAALRSSSIQQIVVIGQVNRSFSDRLP